MRLTYFPPKVYYRNYSFKEFLIQILNPLQTITLTSLNKYMIIIVEWLTYLPNWIEIIHIYLVLCNIPTWIICKEEVHQQRHYRQGNSDKRSQLDLVLVKHLITFLRCQNLHETSLFLKTQHTYSTCFGYICLCIVCSRKQNKWRKILLNWT